MTAAIQAKIIEIVHGAAAGLTWVGDDAAMPLEQMVGADDWFELVIDESQDASHVTDMTLCSQGHWREDLLLRIRKDVAGTTYATVRNGIAALMRQLVLALRNGSWAGVLDSILVGHRRWVEVPFTGADGEALAVVAELPIRITFFE